MTSNARIVRHPQCGRLIIDGQMCVCQSTTIVTPAQRVPVRLPEPRRDLVRP